MIGALALAIVSFAAFAQSPEPAQEKTVAKLRVNKGVVMTSKGGEFATGTTGEELIKDERLMVTKDSSATVIFNDHCQHTYDDPGVYKIDADCKAIAWWGGATAALIVAGAVAVDEVVKVVEDNGNPKVGGTSIPPPISQ